MRYLDIHGTIMLRMMPMLIGRLSRLQKLTDFMVDKNQGAAIGELQKLVDLKDSLRL